MSHHHLSLRQAVWTVCACVLLLPCLAAAESSPPIDFDGDGQRDQFVLDRRESSVLHVRLSASDTTQVIRTRARLLQVVAADLDGDHRPELIARDSESRIHVWTRKGKRFHSYHPRSVVPPGLKQQDRRSLEDKDGEQSGAIASAPFTPLALTPCPSSRTPGLVASTVCMSHATRACRSSAASDPFAPRPPPSHVPI